MNKDKKPLYRKVNTRARHNWHWSGSEARYDRHTKKGLSKSMKKGVQRGLDYTPLYMFLLSKVGQDWDVIHSEAVSRLKGADVDAVNTIVVDKDTYRTAVKEHLNAVVRCGESSKYSALYVDENNILQKVDPTFTNEQLFPSCTCCTHTFNGKVLVNKFCPNKQIWITKKEQEENEKG